MHINSTSPPSEERSARERIAADHREVLGLLKQLETHTQPSGIREIAYELTTLLDRHFKDEEGVYGVFAQIEEARPDLQGQVSRLRDQHRAIEELIGTIRFDDDAHALSDRDRVVQMIREHEAAETELLTEAIYEDLGVGD